MFLKATNYLIHTSNLTHPLSQPSKPAHNHSPPRPSFVSAVEGVQLPSPFFLGSIAPATAAAPAPHRRFGCLHVEEMTSMLDAGERGGDWAFYCIVRFENKQLIIIKMLSYIEIKITQISAR
jgi:hypothetical protein